jgi:hypothetical protein
MAARAIPGYDIIDVNVRYKHAATGLIGVVSVKSLADAHLRREPSPRRNLALGA